MFILNELQIGLILGFLKGKKISCPLCKSGQYQVQSEILELKFMDETEGKNLIIGGLEKPKLPVVGIMCLNCYSFQFMSAVMLKLFPSPEEIKQQKDNLEETQDQKQEEKLTIN